jgi:divalent metal cation (Fe/Co/Zn/Cd) transporter
MANKKSKSKSDTAGGLVFVGALMVGIGLGIFYGNTAVGTLVGLGIGFILFGLIKAFMKG